MGQKQTKHVTIANGSAANESANESANAAAIDPRPHTPLKVIEEYHARLYNTFNAGTCRPLEYRKQQLRQLARMCQENADALADAIYQDLGKPKLEALAYEVAGIVQRSVLCIQRLDEWAKPEKVSVPEWQQAWSPTVYRNPKGPVLTIAPWNYPLVLSLQPLYSAISAGCPAVVKPSEYVPAYAALIAELLPKYLDSNAYVVVNGAVPETTKLLELRWAHIFYTGNGKVGRIIASAAAKHLTPVSLELGGKSPCLIDANTADVKIAAGRILYGKCANAGQTCVAPDYVLVQREAQDALVNAFKEVIAERYPEGPLKSDSYGRMVNKMHYDRLTKLLARSKGRVAIGGETDVERLKIAPTILTDVSGADSLMEDELFGPILPVVPVADMDEAIRFINERDHPLAFYAFTENQELKDRLVAETLSGSLIFNDTFDQLAVDDLPFCGVGESGYGAQILKYGYDGFTHHRASMDVPFALEPHLSTRYPPFTPEKLDFFRGIVNQSVPKL